MPGIIPIANAAFLAATSLFALFISRRMAKKLTGLKELLLTLLVFSLAGEFLLGGPLLGEGGSVNGRSLSYTILLFAGVFMFERAYSGYRNDGYDDSKGRGLLVGHLFFAAIAFAVLTLPHQVVYCAAALGIGGFALGNGFAVLGHSEKSPSQRTLSLLRNAVFSAMLAYMFFRVVRLPGGIAITGEPHPGGIWNQVFYGAPLFLFYLSSLALPLRAMTPSEKLEHLKPVRVRKSLEQKPKAQSKSTADTRFEVSSITRLLKDRLSQVEHVDTSELESSLAATEKAIDSPLLITVLGEFSSGKSTFINALLGTDLLAMNIRPTTATITQLRYGTSTKLVVEYGDGARKDFSVERLHEFTASDFVSESELTDSVFKADLHMNNPLLEHLEIADTPGFNSGYEYHSEITAEFIRYSDVVLWLLDPLHVDKQTTRGLMESFIGEIKPYAVVNKMDLLERQVDDSEQLESEKARIRDSLAEMFEEVFFVSSKKALERPAEGSSGIPRVRNYLNDVLVPQAREIKHEALLAKLGNLSGQIKAVFDEFGEILDSCRATLEKYQDTRQSLEDRQKNMIAMESDIEKALIKNPGLKKILLIVERYSKRLKIHHSQMRKVGQFKKKAKDLDVQLEGLDKRLRNLNARAEKLERELRQLELKWMEYNEKGFGLKRLADDYLGWGTKERKELNRRSQNWDSRRSKYESDVDAYNSEVSMHNTERENLLERTADLLDRIFQSQTRKVAKEYDMLAAIFEDVKVERPRYEKAAAEFNSLVDDISPALTLLERRISEKWGKDGLDWQPASDMENLMKRLADHNSRLEVATNSKRIYTPDELSERLKKINLRYGMDRKTKASISYEKGQRAPVFK